MNRDLALAITAIGAAASTFGRMKLTGGKSKMAWVLIALNAARALRYGTRVARGRSERVSRVRG